MENKKYLQRINEMKEFNPFANQTDMAYKIIIEDVLSGCLDQGEKINQEQLSQQLNMSRTPIREALFKLEEEGIVIKTTKGYQVYTINARDYVNFYEYRIKLEAFAAFLSARLITDEELLDLKAILSKYIEAVDSKDIALISKYDVEFHCAIVNSSKNTYLISAYNNLKIKNQIFINNLYQTGKYSNASKKKHMDIYKAIRDRNEKLAEEVMVSHISIYLYKISDIC